MSTVYSNQTTCQLTKSEIALRFTNYLLLNKFLTVPGRMLKDRLIQYFDFYLITNQAPVRSADILSILDDANLLKRKTISSPEHITPYVEFKSFIFETDFTSRLKFLGKLDPSVNDLNCIICKQTFSDVTERKEHEETDIHKLRDTYRRDRKSFPTKIHNVEITQVPKTILGINEFRNIEINVKNIASEPYTVEVHDIFELFHLNDIKTVYVCPRILQNGESFKFTMQVRFSEYGAKLFPVALKISKQLSPKYKYLLIETMFSVIENDLLTLMPIEPYRPVAKNNVLFVDADIIKSEKLLPTMNALEVRVPLGLYKIPDPLNTVLNHKFKIFDSMSPKELETLEYIRRILCNSTKTKVLHNIETLCDKNYVDRFRLLMWIEEHQAHEEMRLYNQTDVPLLTNRLDNGFYGIEVLGLSEGRPSVLKGDIVYIRKKDNVVKFEGIVHAVEETTVFVAPNEIFEYKEGEKVDVEFTFTRKPLRLCHRALDQLKTRKMTNILFPSLYEKKPRRVKLSMFNKLIAENEQQSQAVINIVENKAYPAPYILFGPPGTGKTATLVEAITQVYKKFENSRICVCAPSNSAADVITERLLEYIVPLDIMRLYGMSRAEQEVSPNLIKCSNYDRIRGELFVPLKSQIKSKRIIVITPVTAGRLVNAGIKGGFFDYVFMDEAGHAVEVEMIIPIVGFLTKPKKSKELLGSLVLAGDPKQLGPVVRSKLAATLGFDVSLLERIMSQCKLYEKNPDYNPEVITKLINNYRSHEEILHIPNICFYDNELKAKGPIEKITCASAWKELNDPNFPVIFHAVHGFEDRESSSPSYFNLNEIQIVKNYVENLLGCEWKNKIVTQKDIGIITPYRKQVQKIRQYLKMKNWDEIDVASVEEFQGQERLIIIISTVRSRFELVATDYQFGLGFLRNAKRFNVALTRAIALLIVIGNPDVLQCDPNWRKFIEYCMLKNSYKGAPPSGSVPKNFDPNEKLALDLSALAINADQERLDERPGFSRSN